MISVVICTRDRASKLERCLLHMVRNCASPGVAWQLVVVDNGSRDDTKAVVVRSAGCLPVKYAYEAKRGLSHARNRGIAEAQYPIIAFTDDDCLIHADWVQTIVREFERQPYLSILGGKVELADSTDYPISIRIHDHAERVTTVAQLFSVMSGCNMAFRRDVFATVGLFDSTLGKGRPTGSAEDVDLFYRALKRGTQIGYSPDVLVRHAHGRDTRDALDIVTRDYLRGRGAFYCKFIRDPAIAKMAYWEIRNLVCKWWRLPLNSHPRKVLCSLAVGAFYRCVYIAASRVLRIASTLGGSDGSQSRIPGNRCR